MGEDQVSSEEFPRLAIKILDVQRQTALDVFQFTADGVTRLIELIDRKEGKRPTTLHAFEEGAQHFTGHDCIQSHLKGAAFRVLRRLCTTFQGYPVPAL